MKLESTIGKHIYFIDRCGAFRINKVISINGNTITTEDAVGGKERIHPETTKILGIVIGTKDNSPILEQIEYKQTRIGRKIKNKKIRQEINATIIKPLAGKKLRVKRKI